MSNSNISYFIFIFLLILDFNLVRKWWLSCLCISFRLGDGPGIGGLWNKSELGSSGALQNRDNTRSSGETLAQERQTKNRTFKNFRDIRSCADITRALLDPWFFRPYHRQHFRLWCRCNVAWYTHFLLLLDFNLERHVYVERDQGR